MVIEAAKRQVQEYWDQEPCDTWYGRPFPEGSLEFFEQMEENRYRGQGFIHSFAQFTRWHGRKVLEVGCGCGTDLLQFARAGAQVHGIDLSEHSVELTRKRLRLYGLHAEVAHGDAESLPFPADYFDLVILLGGCCTIPPTWPERWQRYSGCSSQGAPSRSWFTIAAP